MTHAINISVYSISLERLRALLAEFNGEIGKIDFTPNRTFCHLEFSPMKMESAQGEFTLTPIDLAQRFANALHSYRRT